MIRILIQEENELFLCRHHARYPTTYTEWETYTLSRDMIKGPGHFTDFTFVTNCRGIVDGYTYASFDSFIEFHAPEAIRKYYANWFHDPRNVGSLPGCPWYRHLDPYGHYWRIFREVTEEGLPRGPFWMTSDFMEESHKRLHDHWWSRVFFLPDPRTIEYYSSEDPECRRPLCSLVDLPSTRNTQPTQRCPSEWTIFPELGLGLCEMPLSAVGWPLSFNKHHEILRAPYRQVCKQMALIEVIYQLFFANSTFDHSVPCKGTGTRNKLINPNHGSQSHRGDTGRSVQRCLS
jgi:hypothetical protein